MNPRAGSAADARSALFRRLPSVDELANRPRLVQLAHQVDRAFVIEAVRTVLGELRALGARDREAAAAALGADPAASLEARVVAEIERALAPSLRPVINATGVILHTNLGRAPLIASAVDHIRAASTAYSNLEYDLEAGQRGKRDVHTARLLARLAGAESAIIVNNNAAAVFMVLNALAKGGEVIVSRGELIEIGDGFRIPDIMSESGAILREVGTTNRTRLSDYERAVSERTKLLLRVHPSNFRIVGFTERPRLEELVELGRRTGLPVFEDLGSGCLADLAPYGLDEPVVRASLDAGASVVSFSGDKLLGGPQAGIIAGKKDLIERIRRSPLFRAMRVDKLTIAALEATLVAYLCGSAAAEKDQVPALRMIRMTAAEIESRAAAFFERVRALVPQSEAGITLLPGFSVVGGGSTPGEQLPTRLVAVTSPRHSAAQLETRMRKPSSGLPVIARVEDDRLVIDLRTVFPAQESALAAALAAALR
jgi:L-seryl-tRNA(Ser) seleniumtransferase